MIPLTFANIGQEHKIQRISGNSQVKKHLENLGFIVGSDITVISSLSGNVIVNVKESRIAISKELAQKIMI
ncbi:FeoA family protein [Floccifex sp.]|uniref:FeoA family protein n=1 Tax=Floccifex sp. TaxID=2815810 RepID=UPI002A75378F|nr:FeoA family protein [Floccifex sp.]MDD7281094.1 FeoA family protein [Erysipelotrichaceae bacterium]MDY2958843.1 FeoA family protein [Floccifex sp.]